MTTIGVAFNGGNPSCGRAARDDYPTPISATEALLENYYFAKDVWEPACGRGIMSAVLKDKGYNVTSTDIHPYGYGTPFVNFLEEQELRAPAIVTNPPWNLAEDFIRHGLELGAEQMALLLKATYWHAKRRAKLFFQHPPRYELKLTWRLDFQEKGRPVMECAWYIWEKGYQGPMISNLLMEN